MRGQTRTNFLLLTKKKINSARATKIDLFKMQLRGDKNCLEKLNLPVNKNFR